MNIKSSINYPDMTDGVGIIEKIYETRNYDQFKKIPSNRKLYRPQVDYLKSLIIENNRLSEFPVIVTKNMEVIDGQHRLQAAREMGLPVFYKIGKNLIEEDIITYNSTAKAWLIDDYLNYYCSKEKPAYLEFKKYLEKYNLKFGMAIRLLGAGNSQDLMKNFRSGSFRLKNLEHIHDVMEKVATITEFLNQKLDAKLKAFIRSGKFQMALFNFMADEDVDIDTFIRKLSIKITTFIQCGTLQQYYQMFEKIYNYKNPRPVQFLEDKQN